MKKRVLSWILTLALLLTLMPAAVVPARAATKVTSWGGLVTAMSAGGEVMLDTDITIPAGHYSSRNRICVRTGFVLDLNGHKLDLNGNPVFFCLHNGTTIKDSDPTTSHTVVSAVTGETIPISGGVITGAAASNGTMFDGYGGPLTLAGGSLSGNCATGKLLNLDNVKFTMTGGTISHCSVAVDSSGEAELISSKQILISGGHIVDNQVVKKKDGYSLLDIKLSGLVEISGNIDGSGNPANAANVQIVGAIDSNSHIGLIELPNKEYPNNFAATAWNLSGLTDPNEVFFDSSGEGRAAFLGDGAYANRVYFAKRFKLAYDGNGAGVTGVPGEQLVSEGETPILSTTVPTRADYDFAGWALSAAAAEPDYQPGDAFTGTIAAGQKTVLYAVWKPGSITISYDANGGSGAMATQTVQRGTAAALTPNAFTRAGYSFERWNTAADGSGTDYTDAQTITPMQNVKLYAVWSPCITLLANDGSERKLVQNVVPGAPTTLRANPFTRTGCDFLGWNTVADGSGTSYADRADVGVVTGNLVLYAQWKVHTYTVRYNANGGVGEMPDQAFACGTAQELYACSFGSGPQRFTGWALSPNGAAVYADRQSVVDLTTVDGGVVTLYAVWRGETQDARVSVRQGNTGFGAANGKLGDWYQFRVPGDIYNLVTEHKGRTVTSLARADSEGVRGYSAVSKEPVNSVLVVKPDTPDIVVGGLDAAAREGYRSGEVTLTMTVERVPESPADARHSAIRAAAGSEELEFYEFSLSRSVQGAVDRDFRGETAGNITVYIPLEGEERETKVYRWHNGVVETLPFGTGRGEYAAIEGGWLAIHANKFSAYAIGTPTGKCPRDHRCPISAYTDSSPQAWYHDGVHWALAEGVMIGFPKQLFKPNDDISRAQIVMMLWRMSGCPAGSRDCPFTDAQPGRWFSDAVRWAADTGVVKGRSATKFDPKAPITREELAAILYRYTQNRNGIQPESWWLFLTDYQDSGEISDWAYEAMSWAAFSKIFVGTLTSNGSRLLEPRGNASRAQTATVVMRWWEGLLPENTRK